ncbi:MAG: hypothetical protein Kow00104_14810 [Rhodothalassiaceae bacterium]
MSKTAIVVCSDPASGSDEALGRLFNALFLAYELMEKKKEVAIVYQGAGARWPAELRQTTHPAHILFTAVSALETSICGGCADAFGATTDARKTGIRLDYQKAMPGTPGILDLSDYLDRGFSLVIF